MIVWAVLSGFVFWCHACDHGRLKQCGTVHEIEMIVGIPSLICGEGYELKEKGGI